jgi:hypothetical protein
MLVCNAIRVPPRNTFWPKPAHQAVKGEHPQSRAPPSLRVTQTALTNLRAHDRAVLTSRGNGEILMWQCLPGLRSF